MVVFILRDNYGCSDSICSRAKITCCEKMLLIFRKELLGVYLEHLVGDIMNVIPTLDKTCPLFRAMGFF